MGFPLPVPCTKQIVIHGRRRCHRRAGQVFPGTQVGGRVAVKVGGAVSGSVSQKVAVAACPLRLP
jgi:hypothetical protein